MYISPAELREAAERLRAAADESEHSNPGDRIDAAVRSAMRIMAERFDEYAHRPKGYCTPDACDDRTGPHLAIGEN